MNITETKHVLHIELRPEETAETLDKELSEFCGMLFTFDNTQNRAICLNGDKRIAHLGFISECNAKEYTEFRRTF